MNHFVNQNENFFGEDDVKIMINSMAYINQLEKKINNNKNNKNNNDNNNNNCINQNSIDNINNLTISSTITTIDFLDQCSHNLNNNSSFFSFEQKPQKEQKRKLTQKDIEILEDFRKIEKEIIDNNKFIFPNITIIKELKSNIEKMDNNLNVFFKKPFMRKNQLRQNLFQKLNDKYNEKEEKIGKNINIKKNNKDKMNISSSDINNINNVNDIGC